jgi:hypothetical protein
MFVPWQINKLLYELDNSNIEEKVNAQRQITRPAGNNI